MSIQETSASVTETDVPGGWSQQELSIAGRTFRLVLPKDPDAFLDALAERPVEEHDTTDVYWAMLWQAAPGMARRILERTWPSDAEALEFGCGLGLVGLAAAAAGMRVTFSDYEPMAVRTALENAKRNEFHTAEGAVLDWREPPPRTWPFVFGCDVLYNRDMHEALIGFLDRVLAPDGLCWIGDAGRFHAGKFLALAESRGFQTRLEDEHGALLPQVRHGKFQMFALTRKSVGP